MNGGLEEKKNGDLVTGRRTEKLHTFQSPHVSFCSVYKEKPSGRKKDYDYL